MALTYLRAHLKIVIPAQAGIYGSLNTLDSRFRGNDGITIYRGTLKPKCGMGKRLLRNPPTLRSNTTPCLRGA